MAALAETPTATTRRVLCPGCGSIVLASTLRAGRLVVLLEREEVYPRERCRTCRSARLRHETEPCWRCHAEPGVPGYVGEELRGYGAAIGDDDLARLVDLSRAKRERGEAIHRAHTCSVRPPG